MSSVLASHRGALIEKVKIFFFIRSTLKRHTVLGLAQYITVLSAY